MRQRPLIGVTGPAGGGGAAWLLASLAIARAGGVPYHITPASSVKRVAARLEGLVVGGGVDIHPDLYHGHGITWSEVIAATAKEASDGAEGWRTRLWAEAVFLLRYVLRGRLPAPAFDHGRDSLEIEVLRHAVARDLPILGICRGAQLLNVYFGGTLYGEVHGFYAEPPQRTVFPRRIIQVDPASRLSSLVGGTSFRVNALHHQAVKTLGRGLRAVAWDEGCVIQAIEQSDHPYRIGVQWHPEFIPQHDRQVALFRALVDAARR